MDLCELWHNHPTPVLAISRKDGSATVVRVLVWLVLVCLGKRARSAPRSVLVLVCLCGKEGSAPKVLFQELLRKTPPKTRAPVLHLPSYCSQLAQVAPTLD